LKQIEKFLSHLKIFCTTVFAILYQLEAWQLFCQQNILVTRDTKKKKKIEYSKYDLRLKNKEKKYNWRFKIRLEIQEHRKKKLNGKEMRK